jgi:hypothetical protein
MAWRNQAVLDLALFAQAIVYVHAARFFNPVFAMKRSVNWLPLSVSSLTILTGQVLCTFHGELTLLLSV